MEDYSCGMDEGEFSPSSLLENDEISPAEEGFMLGERMAWEGDDIGENEDSEIE